MNIWQERWLLAPMDDEFDGGGGGEEVYPMIEEGDDGIAPDISEGDQTQQQSQAAMPSFDPNQFAAAIAKGLREGQGGGQQPQAPAQMSDEEYRKATKYFAVAEDHINALFNSELPPAQRAAKLQEILDGAVQHALMVSAYQQRFAMEDFNKQLSPIFEDHKTRAQEKFIDSVVGKYPSLSKNRKLIAMAAQHAASSGMAGQGDPVQTVASIVEATLRQSFPEFSLGQGRRANGNMPKMAGQITGGGGGGSGGGNGGQPKKTFQTLFKK